MRPVERGPAPRAYAQYGDAIGDLEDRLGIYCSYCERCLPTGLAVEHVCPKSRNPDLELDWDNFLLGCTNCNSVKGNKDIELDDYVWPDRDNTLLALSYGKGGFVDVALERHDARWDKARSLVRLVGLDRHPYRQGADKPARRDKRWSQRDTLWDTAEKARDHYKELNESEAARRLIVTAAVGFGFLSIWLYIFDQYPEVKKLLVDAFPGTAKDCFDANYSLVNRPGGVL